MVLCIRLYSFAWRRTTYLYYVWVTIQNLSWDTIQNEFRWLLNTAALSPLREL